MPYMQAMRGDYMASNRGDPGFFSFVKKGIGIAGSLVRRAVSMTPAAMAIQTGGRMLTAMRPGERGGQAFPGLGMGMPGLSLGPGGGGGPAVNKDGTPRRIRKDGQPYKRPSMNAANPRALRRAMRREDSFVKLAKRALKGSKWRIVSGSASRRQPSMRIMESGPGGVTVQR